MRLQSIYAISLRLDNVDIDSRIFATFMQRAFEAHNKWRVTSASAAASEPPAEDASAPPASTTDNRRRRISTPQLPHTGSNQLEMLYSIKLL